MKPVLKITQRSLKLTKRVHVCLVYDPILFQEDRQELRNKTSGNNRL